MSGAPKLGRFRSLASLIFVVNVVGELQRKRTLAASRGFLAAARLSCYNKVQFQSKSLHYSCIGSGSSSWRNYARTWKKCRKKPTYFAHNWKLFKGNRRYLYARMSARYTLLCFGKQVLSISMNIAINFWNIQHTVFSTTYSTEKSGRDCTKLQLPS